MAHLNPIPSHVTDAETDSDIVDLNSLGLNLDFGLCQELALLVAVQRVAELVWSRRNERKLRSRGGREIGARHHPLFLVLHTAWLAALFLGVPASAAFSPILLVVFALLQALRVWVIISLGPYWTTRIITIHGDPLVRHGPYRFFRHPNYLVVTGEVAILPLAFGAWEIALVFSVLNGLLLAWRIRIEERALTPRRTPASSG